MQRRLLLLASLLVFMLILAAGCGDSGNEQSRHDDAEQASADTKTSADGGTANDLDAGPRADQTIELNADLAQQGETLFEETGCTACHALGESDDAPDLRGVTALRTEAWLHKQITNPEWMNEHDAITRQLVEKYDLEMTDLDVTDAEATALLHFLRRESAAARP